MYFHNPIRHLSVTFIIRYYFDIKACGFSAILISIAISEKYKNYCAALQQSSLSWKRLTPFGDRLSRMAKFYNNTCARR